jgi:GTPase SAR1 family protein
MAEACIGTANKNTKDGKTFFKVLCVGAYSGAWSKGVYIEDYMSNNETICENPNNLPMIGGEMSEKCLYDKRGKKIRIQIWNLAEQERCFAINKLYYGNTDGAIVFWGPKSRYTMEYALKYKHEITQIKPDIPFVLLVDNVFQTPEKWMGEGLQIMNSPDEMDSFCLEHGFFAWFEMLERTGGEKSVLGKAVSTLINEIISRNNTVATSENQQRSCIIV